MSVLFSKIMPFFKSHIPVVIGNGAQEKMRRSYTGWVIAFMENIQPLWNGAFVDFPREAMRQTCALTSAYLDLSISGWISMGSPGPTGFSFLNLGKKSTLDRQLIFNTPWHRGINVD